MPKKRDIPYKTYLSENDVPKYWYNIQADLPMELAPMLDPRTREPITDPSAMYPLLARELCRHEGSRERYIEIPGEVHEIYKSYRPSPLVRAYRLEEALGTPARIYYKYEGNNPSGSHKLNSAVPQVYYNKTEGITRLTTETGGGQWGTALSVAAQMFGVELTTYMVRVSYNQKPYRRIIMETYGGKVLASPSGDTEFGRSLLAERADHPGSLGVAIGEAVEKALTTPGTKYSLGSVLSHVLMHQTVIGQEAKKQLESIGEYPDIVIGCCGGGSNFAGIAFPFLHDNLKEGANIKFYAVEPSACPTLTKGRYAYDYSDTAKVTPIVKMYTLGSGFIPPGIHSGGLRFHGDSPIISALYHDKLIDATSIKQSEVFAAAKLFAQCEVILPAPESAHAIAEAIRQAGVCRETGEEKVIVFCLSGNGYLDLSAYDAFNSGNIEDVEYTDEMLEEGLKTLPEID
ncbi:MAG: TrpB-like pyridoxal phosphate-dependent enzyme [Christensenellales bacterium]|jgi:tryptophan synthase beta chain